METTINATGRLERSTSSTWERIKWALRRDWQQTKYDFRLGRGLDLRQDVDDTVKMMTGRIGVPPEGVPNESHLKPAQPSGVPARREKTGANTFSDTTSYQGA